MGFVSFRPIYTIINDDDDDDDDDDGRSPALAHLENYKKINSVLC